MRLRYQVQNIYAYEQYLQLNILFEHDYTTKTGHLQKESWENLLVYHLQRLSQAMECLNLYSIGHLDKN